MARSNARNGRNVWRVVVRAVSLRTWFAERSARRASIDPSMSRVARARWMQGIGVVAMVTSLAMVGTMSPAAAYVGPPIRGGDEVAKAAVNGSRLARAGLVDVSPLVGLAAIAADSLVCGVGKSCIEQGINWVIDQFQPNTEPPKDFAGCETPPPPIVGYHLLSCAAVPGPVLNSTSSVATIPVGIFGYNGGAAKPPIIVSRGPVPAFTTLAAGKAGPGPTPVCAAFNGFLVSSARVWLTPAGGGARYQVTATGLGYNSHTVQGVGGHQTTTGLAPDQTCPAWTFTADNVWRNSSGGTPQTDPVTDLDEWTPMRCVGNGRLVVTSTCFGNGASKVSVFVDNGVFVGQALAGKTAGLSADTTRIDWETSCTDGTNTTVFQTSAMVSQSQVSIPHCTEAYPGGWLSKQKVTITDARGNVSSDEYSFPAPDGTTEPIGGTKNQVVTGQNPSNKNDTQTVDMPLPNPQPPSGATGYDCWPSGWSALNPTNWVVKPLLCLFVPTHKISYPAPNLAGYIPGMTVTDACVNPATTFNGRPLVVHICDGPMASVKDAARPWLNGLFMVGTALFLYGRITDAFGIAYAPPEKKS